MPDFSTLWALALHGLALSGSLALLTWIASVVRRDASLVDRAWSLMIASPLFLWIGHAAWVGPRTPAVLALVVAWAVRLSAYITARNWGHGEDRRYQAIRARNEPHFALKSLVLVFALQAVLAAIVGTPALAALVGSRPFGVLDGMGIAVAAIGFAFETIGDFQMAGFRHDPANRGRVLDRGLWRYTRHPNYFGEALFWWGIWILALAAGGLDAAWSVLSPLLMTGLLLKVSGVALLEKDIGERRPAYRDYIARTNAFIPGPPRRETGE
jgi:steroid 5-alpha reductase family enzyme